MFRVYCDGHLPINESKNTTDIIVLYSFLWTFPICNATNFKLVLKKPVLSISKYIK